MVLRTDGVPTCWISGPRTRLLPECGSICHLLIAFLAMAHIEQDPIFLHRDGPQASKPGFDFDVWKAEKAGFADTKVPEWTAEVKNKYGTTGTRYACVG